MNKYLTFTVPPSLPARTVGEVLRGELKLTRRQISQIKFRENGILLNGEQVRVTAPVKAGDVLRLCFEESAPPSSLLVPKEDCLEVLYEDDDLLAANKPPLIPTHPSGIYYQNSLCNLALAHAIARGEAAAIRPVGRLDLETSGIVLFAKSQIAASRLFAQRNSGVCQKTYLALACGRFLEKGGCIRTPIGPLPGGTGRDRIRMQVCPNGKSALTSYQVVRQFPDFALVRLSLGTGRTHQIRVHLASIGHPLLGDQLYNPDVRRAMREPDVTTISRGTRPADSGPASRGTRRADSDPASRSPLRANSDPAPRSPLRADDSPASLFTRAALHAAQLDLVHPFSGKLLTIKAPLPEDFIRALR